MKVLFAGGGTLGPVTPLLAVAEAWKKIDPSVQFVWVGTRHGPEREVVEASGIRFLTIPVARLPRYPSLEWLFLPFRFVFALSAAWIILSREKPSLIASAGGYTAVPFAWIGGLQRGGRVWIHQQDVRPLLSNRVTTPAATCITTAWQRTLRYFPRDKTVHVGNPVRSYFPEAVREEGGRPTIFVLGGGTGAVWLNHMMEGIAPGLLPHANVIHVTGEGKLTERLRHMGSGYTVREFLMPEEVARAYAAADMVVARAGMGTLSELAASRKPAILIPLPDSAQEENARVVKEAGAAIVLPQSLTSADDLQKTILALLSDKQKQRLLSERMGALLPTDVAETIVRHVRLACRLA
jgi:UDP-N-acetylglucosamine--N-acetylmuramyl-(pentapeptide) pyrophosphoryl-undecaprenol N-acetylglucosamine transferase